MHTFGMIVPFINDLFVLIPAAAYGFGYYKGKGSKARGKGLIRRGL